MYADIKWACNFGILHNNRGTEPNTTNGMQAHFQAIGSQYHLDPGSCIIITASSSGDPMNKKGETCTKDSASAVYTNHIAYGLKITSGGDFSFHTLQQVINSTNTDIIPSGQFMSIDRINLIEKGKIGSAFAFSLPVGTIVSSFNPNQPGFLALTGGDFYASVYPDLADILAGRHDLPDKKVTLPNLGSFTETINYTYTAATTTEIIRCNY